MISARPLTSCQGQHRACPVKVSPRTACRSGCRPPSGIGCKTLQGGRGGGARAIIRQKGRPVTPLTQQRWSEPWVAISWCFWTNTRLLATPRNAGMFFCHRAVVDPRTYPRLSDAWIYIEGTPSGYIVSTRRMPVEQVAFFFFLFFDGSAEAKARPEIDMWAN